MLFTIFIFVVILVILVLVHEAGHFLVAKLCGVKVKEFAFGFPPRIISTVKKGTRYSINLIPLGGYVSLLGEDEAVKEKGSYFSAKIWQKIVIVGTGVLMNFLLAIIVLAIGFQVGMTPLVTDPSIMGGQKTSQVMIVDVVSDSAAAKVNLESGNILNGFSTPEELSNFTKANAGREVKLSVSSGSGTKDLNLTLGNSDAPLGVGVVSITKVKLPFFESIWVAIIEVGKAVGMFFVILWGILKSLFTTGSAGEAGAGVVGPVGIYNFTSQALKIGWIYILQLVAILSINLGIINIMPFPALDGGKIMFLGLEGIFRKKVVRQEVENIIHMVGFVLLIILVLAITLRDIIRFH